MHVIYVDDEKPALDNFRWTAVGISEIASFHLFQNSEEAYEHVKKQLVDAAFLDIEMPEMDGITLAKKIKAYDSNIRVIFVTAYGKYALDAWGVDATGYLLKPYSKTDIKKELAKCTYRSLPSNQVVIETIPSLKVLVNGVPLRISASKPKELLALLVDRGEQGISAGEGIACLWPDRPNDTNTQSLLRMTYKRLADVLEDAGIGHIIASSENRRFLRTDQVECDLYRILAGDKKAEKAYLGNYLQEYSWAEERNSQLYWKIIGNETVYEKRRG